MAICRRCKTRPTKGPRKVCGNCETPWISGSDRHYRKTHDLPVDLLKHEDLEHYEWRKLLHIQTELMGPRYIPSTLSEGFMFDRLGSGLSPPL